MVRTYEKVKEFEKKYPGSIAWRVKKHCKVIDDYINPGEEILLAFAAQKNEKFHDIFNTCVFCLTNKRILIGKKRVLWGSFLYTITPDLYNDTRIYKGLAWGTVTIDTVKEVITLSNISKKGLDPIETTISEFMMTEKKKYKNESEE